MCVCVCARVGVCVRACVSQDRATRRDLKEPGLINAALRPAGLKTQRCFCCPVAQSGFPLERQSRAGRGGGGKGRCDSLERNTLFHSLLVGEKNPDALFLCMFSSAPPLLGCFLRPPTPN